MTAKEQMLAAPSDAFSAGVWCELANDLYAENRIMREALEWIANRYRDDSEDARGIALDTLNRLEPKP